ncbi:MAG: 50S ribosomal protein L10 [Candidatus Pacebacteria bacterium]|nr:50S ribosomal protein L10 [Candidatus Paceibacterota bacterium]MBP9058052.1 50S ribosomal protein L10 [Candidatus Paceibacterota bacterium]MBP9770043.1 50S ribosomal protein L10 [Candidatus Paceibacterota bacterium]
MALTRNKKGEIVEGLKELFVAGNTVVFVEFSRLKVFDSMRLRRILRDLGISYKVARKTLIKRALDDSSIKGDMPELSGEVAIASGTDQLASSRELFNFGRELPNTVKILGGIYEGEYKDSEFFMSLATIPPRETLYSKFAFLMKSPMQRLAIGLNEVAKTKSN